MKRILNTIYKNREWLLLGLVLCFAYYLRIFGIKTGLPYPWHCDEPHMMHTALRILKTGDYNPHDFYYPSLTIYLHAINAALCYISVLSDPLTKSVLSLKNILTNADTGWYWTISHPVFYEWGRRLTVIFATLSVGLVYMICSRYYASLLTAMLSSLFLACCLGHLSLSFWATVDVPAAFFILATAFSSVLLMLKGEKKLYIISGLLTGFSIATKFNSWPVILLPLLGHALNKHKRGFFSPYILFALVAVPLGFLIGCPYAILDLPGFLDGISWNVWYYAHEPGWDVFSSNPDIAWARIPTEKYTQLTQLLFYYRSFCQDRWAMGGGGGVGTYVFYSAILGMLSGFFVNWRVTLLLLSYPIAFVWYMSTMQGNFMRNMTAVNAFLCIFAGLFICQVLNLISSLLKKINVPFAVRTISVCLAGILFLINPVYKAINYSLDNYNTKDSRVLAFDWMKQNIKPTQKAAFASELRWFKPDLDKLGFKYVLIGQFEKKPVWYWNEGFDYLIIGRKYEDAMDAQNNTLLQKNNESFINMTAAQSFGAAGFDVKGWSTNPELSILRVDPNFCNSATWDRNSDFFEFNLNEFQGNSHRKKTILNEKAYWELTGDFCSPKVVFDQGKYEVEIIAYGSSTAGASPLMKLESVKWTDGISVRNEILGEVPVAEEKLFRSGVFDCNKGDSISFNVAFSNKANARDKGADRKLNIQKIIVRKKG